MKRILFVLAMVTSLLLAACGQQTPTAAPQPPQQPAAAVAGQAPAGYQAAAQAPAKPASAAPTLTANPWQWTGFSNPVDQFKVEQPQNYVLTFNSDGRLAIKADCNNVGASYTADDSSLSIKVGPTTMAACPPGSRGDQFAKLLGGAAKYFFAAGALFIDLMADGGTMRFDPAGKPAASAEEVAAAKAAAQMAAAQAAALTENPWKWTTFANKTEKVTVETPASYTLNFHADGTVDIKADCNNAAGTYSLDGNNITIKIGPSTMAACPGKSRGEQFTQLLAGAVKFVALGDSLILSLKDESSAMLFSFALPTALDWCGDKAQAINKIEDGLDPAISAKLDQVLVGFLSGGSRAAPGASMLIITPKGRYLKSTGVADVTTCKPLQADSLFEIGSNTKMMTSAIIFQLQEEGVLKISDPLSKWLPDLAARLPNGDKITIDMLLSHTSGLHDYFDIPGMGGTIEDGAKNKDMLARSFTPEELIKLVADSGLSDFKPGAEGQWKYSNTGYILLGLIIEKATGKSYAENLQTRIFEPLGLKKTALLTGQPKPGTLPQAYVKPPFDYTTSEWNASQGWAAGAVVSTPDEFATFLKALFTGKLFKQASTLKQMQEHTSAGNDALGEGTVYSHGVLDNQGVLGHGGQTLGFQSDGGYIPGKDVTIVIWSNSANNNVTRTAVPAIAALVTGSGK